VATDPGKYSTKVPLSLKCSRCGEPNSPRIRLNETSFDWRCAACGFTHPSLFGLDVTIGVLLLEKSRHELLQEKDYPMAVVFPAMAFESELSRLFGKWKEIECIMPGTIFDREQCEGELRRFASVERKIEEVSRFLVQSGIDDFVRSKPELEAYISSSFQSVRVGHLAEDFQRHLFWPRNGVLHWGDAKYSYEDAAKCFSIAQVGLRILREMDAHRRVSLPS